MDQPAVCPGCGGRLPDDGSGASCPSCGHTLSPPTQAESAGWREAASTAARQAPFAAPAPAELASHFPQLEVLGLLGQGGMGAVYQARQTKLDRLVALKILPPEAGRDPTFAARFAREARTLARLSHPHIVSVHDFGEAGGLYYFLMEYVDGANLRQSLQGGRPGLAETLKVFAQVCDALQYAHEEGVVHRDVKPENILLDRRGRVKMADFGLAKLLGSTLADPRLTATRQAVGTLRYMAPEQLEGAGQVDHRADVYSLGVVLYEMLTGTLPLGRFAPPSEAAPVDPRLDSVVLRALEKDPARRYQQVRELKAAAEAAARGGSPSPLPGRPETGNPVRSAGRSLLRLLGDPGLWALVLCLLGLAVCLEPFSPWGELQVVGAQHWSPPLATVQGYTCPAGLLAGCVYLILCCLFLVTGLPERPPRWRAPLLILAGVLTAGYVGSTILFTGTQAGKIAAQPPTRTMPAKAMPGKGEPVAQPEAHFDESVGKEIRLLGSSFNMQGRFSVGASGASLVLDVEGKEFTIKELRSTSSDPPNVIYVAAISRRRPLSVITATVNVWAYLVAGSGILLLFFGCIDLRRAWSSPQTAAVPIVVST
jgi:hypothetical protein